MNLLNYFFDWGIYEGDIIAAGGKVEYTGEVIYHGYGYVVERAVLSLGEHLLYGYMKRFKMGNAVLCSLGDGDDTSVHKKIAKCNIALALNDVDRRNANFFEWRLLRDFLLWVIGIVEVALLFLVLFAIYKICNGLCIGIFLLLASFIGLSLMFYLRMKCKSGSPLSYKARLWTDERLQNFHMPSDEELLKEKKK